MMIMMMIMIIIRNDNNDDNNNDNDDNDDTTYQNFLYEQNNKWRGRTNITGKKRKNTSMNFRTQKVAQADTILFHFITLAVNSAE